MFARARKSRDGTPGMVWQAEPGDLPVTGTGSDGRYTTFSTDGKYQFTARNIHDDEAFWLGAMLPCISAACIAWIALGGSFEWTNPGPLVLLTLFGVGLLGKSIREESFAWKEMLFIIAVVALLGNGGDSGALWLASGICAFLLIRYAWLWKERAVWEPFVFLALFWCTLFGHRIGILPDAAAAILFIGVALFSLLGLMTILASGWTYSKGLNSISE